MAAAFAAWAVPALFQKPGERLVISWDGTTLESLSLGSQRGTRYGLLCFGENGASFQWFEDQRTAQAAALACSEGLPDGLDNEKDAAGVFVEETLDALGGENAGGSSASGLSGNMEAAASWEGWNLLAVSKEEVSMLAADCPDQICVRHRPISRGGEGIICLPHKLAVEIWGEEESLDGMTGE